MDNCWLEEDRGLVRIWTLNRVAASNALSRAARRELEQMVASVAGASHLRAVIITGSGNKAFSAGADLAERSAMSETEVLAWLTDLRRTLDAIEASPKVFVAAINGAALGGGLELALACDIRVAAPKATLGLPEVRLAIIPGGGGTQRLPRLIGLGKALEMILTGQRVTADEAAAIGLVDRVARTDDNAPALMEALAMVQRMEECAPLALAAAKKAVRAGFEIPLSDGLDLERAAYESLLGSSDRLEGLAAFSEKRPPRYTGR